MVVQSLEADKGPFGPMEEDEKNLGAEVPIKALMYLANYTIPDIAFVVNFVGQVHCRPNQKTLGWHKNHH
jgi:hypothetical protein